MLNPRTPQRPPGKAILTSLNNEMVALADRIILVLDDYHTIGSYPVDDALVFMLEYLPPQIPLVIATREDPGLPLSRLRARGQLAELLAVDLRFTTSEAAEFLNQEMGLALSEEDVKVFETRTEGWIAGLQLAAISLQGREDTTRLIGSFSGSHRLVLDYLIEEVLGQQSESIQDFLFRTSVLNRLTGSLCNAVRFGEAKSPTGQEDGQAILEMLENANLFISCIGPHSGSYFGDSGRPSSDRGEATMKKIHLKACLALNIAVSSARNSHQGPFWRQFSWSQWNTGGNAPFCS